MNTLNTCKQKEISVGSLKTITFSQHSNHLPCVVLTHLLTNWIIIINISNSHFHSSLGHKEAICGSDVQIINVLLFPIQRPFNINFPLILNQSQSEFPLGIPSCNKTSNTYELWCPFRAPTWFKHRDTSLSSHHFFHSFWCFQTCRLRKSVMKSYSLCLLPPDCPV